MDDEQRRFGQASGAAGLPDAAAATGAVRRVRVIAGGMALGIVMAVGVLGLMHAAGSAGDVAVGEAMEPVLGAIILLAAVLLVAAPFVERALLSRGGGGAVQRYQTAKVVSLALRETVGLLGFVVGFLSGSLLWAVALAGASLLAIAIAWPREADLASRPADLPPPSKSSIDPE
jgi:hypothetical protein